MCTDRSFIITTAMFHQKRINFDLTVTLSIIEYEFQDATWHFKTPTSTTVQQCMSMTHIIIYTNRKTILKIKETPVYLQATTNKMEMTLISPPGRSWFLSECRSIAIGIPTFLERPTTSTFLPTVSMPEQKKRQQNLSKH